jgi:predicted nucleotidyltransferase
MINTNLQTSPEGVAAICQQFHVLRLRLFGSAVRGELGPVSDVDILVDYEAGFVPSLFQIVELSERLRPIFGGRDVDLVLPNDLHWFIRDDILDSAKTIYER